MKKMLLSFVASLAMVVSVSGSAGAIGARICHVGGGIVGAGGCGAVSATSRSSVNLYAEDIVNDGSCVYIDVRVKSTGVWTFSQRTVCWEDNVRFISIAWPKEINGVRLRRVVPPYDTKTIATW